MEYNKTIRGKHSLTDLAYIAGLVDGEGCIGIYSYPDERGVSRLHILDVTVTNNNPDCYKFLQQRFGGRVHSRRANSKWNISHQWKIRNGQAKEFLELIGPYLLLKKQQAQLGIKFIEYKGKYKLQKNGKRFSHPLTKEEIEKRENFYIEMRKLNSKYNNRYKNSQPQRLSEETLKSEAIV